MGRRVSPGRSPGTPRVSIVLCTYNRAALVMRAVRSVRRQTFRDWELIIVDDGSSDGTPRVLAGLPLRDPRIVIVRQANRGLTGARNAGLALARGAFITFLDSDDAYAPGHLRQRVSAMMRYPKVDMLYGGLDVRGPKERQYVADLERPGRLIHVTDCYVGGTFFLRRKIVEKGYRFREVGFGEDYDLFRRIARRFRVRDLRRSRTYIYHCDTADRLCDVYTEAVARSTSAAGSF